MIDTPSQALVELMARTMMSVHLGKEWRFKWDGAVNRLGQCNRQTKTIQLSRPYTSRLSTEEWNQTILHEIAHALTKGGHDDVFRRMLVSLGGKPENRYEGEVRIPAPWIGTCPYCDKISSAFRRTNVACTKCCNEYNNGHYDEDYKIEWTRA